MDSACIVASAKDEAPFLVEWCAHHFALGFDKIFVATNDCSDGTEALIAAIGAVFPIYHVDNPAPLADRTVQTSAVRRCIAHTEAQDQTWALHIDLDEFVHLEAPGQDVSGFLEAFAECDVVSMAWKIFGDAGYGFWHGGNLLDTFLMAASDPTQGSGVKNFFRLEKFSGSHPHRPKDLKVPSESIRAVTTQMIPLDTKPFDVGWMTSMRVPEAAQTWAGGCINHYIHRSQDLATATRIFRGDANGRNRAAKRRTVGHKQYNAYNLNLVEDRAIRQTHTRRQAIMNQMFSIPEVRKLHYAGMAVHFACLVSIHEEL
ncbi:glycosyltransferase family 2 protein [Pseudopelagicola sp. nBUS_19]|uniref:glycosyltransferase family 2 protein n=1 Tax=Pseudopelagicola sp. nBUS_19 TaxID=3395316 RepID=UPI003EBE5E80